VLKRILKKGKNLPPSPCGKPVDFCGKPVETIVESGFRSWKSLGIPRMLWKKTGVFHKFSTGEIRF
jgi:hypothetical protein